MTPNLDNILLWVEALESGDYEQGFEKLHLRRPDGRETFCCLGVACVVAIANGVPLKVESSNPVWEFESAQISYDYDAELLPPKVVEWLGLPASNPILIDRCATEWNDVDEADFDGLARLIREEYGLPAREAV